MPASKKLYECLAHNLKELVAAANYDSALVDSTDFAIAITNCLQADNPRFKAEKFLTACGLPDLAANWEKSRPF